MYDQPTSQQVALTYFQGKPNVQVFGSFADQMTAGALTAFKQLGITPGKDLQVLGSGGTNQTVAQIKAGTVFGTVALYPSTESYIAIKAPGRRAPRQEGSDHGQCHRQESPLIITQGNPGDCQGLQAGLVPHGQPRLIPT